MFESALIESQKKKAPRNKWLIINTAIVLHVASLAGILAAQYWAIEDVPEPPLQVSFLTPVAPKPVPVPQAPVEIQQPVVVPEIIPEAPSEPVSEGVEGVEGVEGGVEGGVAGGVVGGTPNSVGDEILRVGGEITKPERLGGAAPAYTELARKARIQGVVIVEAIIDKEGKVTNVRVLKGLPMGLDQAAVDAVKSWRFRPATLNGRPVSVYYSLTVNFRLQ